jgi:hypothetical protein
MFAMVNLYAILNVQTKTKRCKMMEARKFARLPKIVIDKIAELTDMNEHGIAFVRLAKINCEHMDHGYLPVELCNERNAIRVALYLEAKDTFANYEEIMAAF